MFSYTPLRIVSLVYNKTDIPLPARRIEMIWHSAFCLVSYITSYSSRCRGISVKSYLFKLVQVVPHIIVK